MNSKFFSLAEALVAVARNNSITEAALELRASKSSISQKITELEAHLDVTLFHRSTRKIELTPAGHQMLAQCTQAVDAISQARFETGFNNIITDEISGVVTLSGSNIYLTKAIIPILGDFQKAYPNVKINLIGSDRPVNLRDNNIDLNIRIGDLVQEDTIITPLNPLKRLLCASPVLIAKSPAISHPRHLENLALVTREQEPPQWQFQKGAQSYTVDVATRHLVVNSIELCHESVKTGLGVAVLAELVVAGDIQNGHINRLLLEWEIRNIQVNLLARKGRINRPAVRLLHHHISTNLGVG